LETILHDAYQAVSGEDADAKQLGYSALLRRLKRAGAPLGPAVETQMDLIYTHRNEALGVMLMTRDVVTKLGALKSSRE